MKRLMLLLSVLFCAATCFATVTTQYFKATISTVFTIGGRGTAPPVGSIVSGSLTVDTSDFSFFQNLSGGGVLYSGHYLPGTTNNSRLLLNGPNGPWNAVSGNISYAVSNPALTNIGFGGPVNSIGLVDPVYTSEYYVSCPNGPAFTDLSLDVFPLKTPSGCYAVVTIGVVLPDANGNLKNTPLFIANVLPYCLNYGGDSDGDGLCDDWETKGFIGANGVFVDLHAMGADPMHPDIFVQTDYMVGSTGDNHKPDPIAISTVVNAFAAHGITLHVDCGRDCPNGSGVWGDLSKANALPHVSVLGCYDPSDTNYDWSDFNKIKAGNFPPERSQIFHYMIFAHDQGGSCLSISGAPGGRSGVSKGVPGSDFLVSLGQSTLVANVGKWTQQAGTFMHELGHNLSLGHGGDEDINYKPNYLSVMNYRFQMRGLLIGRTSNHYDYSEFVLPPLDETALNESAGLSLSSAFATYGTAFACENKDPKNGLFQEYSPADGPIDWNCDNAIAPSATDINSDGNKSSLHGYYDWPHLVLAGGSVGDKGDSVQFAALTPGEPDPGPDLSSDSFGGPQVSVIASRTASLTHSGSNNLVFVVFNPGTTDSVYVLSATSSLPWIDLSTLPTSVAVRAGQTTQVTIPVSVPANIPAGTTGNLSLVANTQPSIPGFGEFTIDLTVVDSALQPSATPTFSPAPGTFTAAQTVSITDATTGAAIYFTTNGTTPTTSSTLYSGPINVSSSETIQAIAVATGYTASPVASATYTINIPIAATPSFSPAPGTFIAAQTVSITDATNGAAIYFTTNGTTPTTSSTLYTGPITVSSSQTIQAIAVVSGYTTSPIASATYTINLPVAAATPTFSPAAGVFSASQTVAIADATPGATIYLTTNGTIPTASSTIYTGPISVSSSQTIQAIAVASGYITSPVASATYTINLPTLPQDFSMGLSATSLAVTAGQSGTLNVSITPANGFNQAVSFTCAGLPSGSACSFSPATLTPNGTAVGTTTVTVTTAAKTSLLERNRPYELAGVLAGLGLWFAGRRFRRLGRLGALLLMTIGLGSFISGCGTNPITQSEPTTSTVSINAVSGSLTHTATFSLTVK